MGRSIEIYLVWGGKLLQSVALGTSSDKNPSSGERLLPERQVIEANRDGRGGGHLDFFPILSRFK
jgi:hypothetical protein